MDSRERSRPFPAIHYSLSGFLRKSLDFKAERSLYFQPIQSSGIRSGFTSLFETHEQPFVFF
jgi:hypothetical protein